MDPWEELPLPGELVTLTFMADTSNVTFLQGAGFTQYTNIPSTAIVTVATVGTATFSDPTSLSVFAFPTFSEFSATDTSLGTDILDTFAITAGFAGYNMQDSLNPVNGGAAYSVGTPFATNLGDFELHEDQRRSFHCQRFGSRAIKRYHDRGWALDRRDSPPPA